jgi:starch-binding outer membrane protein, SusD/RagB family
MRNRDAIRGAGRTSRAALAVLCGAATLAVAACEPDRLLEVEEREYPTDETLLDPTALPLLIRGAYGEFFRAYAGNDLFNLGFSPAVALFTDEMESVDTFSDRNAMDERSFQPPSSGNSSDLAYSRLQRARRATRNAAESVATVRGANDPDRATLLAMEGYSLVALAEGWCSAVPLSNLVDGQFVPGTPLTRGQLLDTALVRFDASLAASANNLARVGRGRALINHGRFSEAATAVADVPDSFQFLIEHSENTLQNSFWNLINSNRRMSVGNMKGGNGLNFRTANDPRVGVFRTGTRLGFDEQTPLWEQEKYPDRDADVVLANGQQARLIEAEAALRANNPGQMITILNGLRAGVTGLAPLTDPGTEAGRVDLLFRERAFWLYLTGTRPPETAMMNRRRWLGPLSPRALAPRWHPEPAPAFGPSHTGLIAHHPGRTLDRRAPAAGRAGQFRHVRTGGRSEDYSALRDVLRTMSSGVARLRHRARVRRVGAGRRRHCGGTRHHGPHLLGDEGERGARARTPRRTRRRRGSRSRRRSTGCASGPST